MKKLFTLLVLLVAIVTGAQAETETPGKTGTKDSDLSGTSFTIAGTYIAGEGSASLTPMVTTGVKIRTNKNGNILPIQVKAGYVITGLTIYGITNDNSKTLDVTSITVDGNEKLTSSITIPNKKASEAATITLSDITAASDITLTFGSNGASQANLDFHFTYILASNEPSTVTFNAGDNGTCETASLTEETAGAGVTLPAVTANDGYFFDGWYTAATEGTKVGDAGETYKPTADVTLYAQYSTSYTVTFNAGDNGTCETASLTEETAGAGVTLPAVTANEGYVFNGWYTAATEGTKAGDAGETYYPSENGTLYAQYSQKSAPTIEIDNYAPSTSKGIAVTLTATVTGAPDPTVTWYKNGTDATTGGTSVGTGATYAPDVTTEGEFYYYAVASNGIEPDATSELITLTVINPDVTISGNNYYIAAGDQKVAGAKVNCDDITMQFVGFTGTTNTAAENDMITSLNSNYVASIATGTNAWGVEFTPTSDGILKAAVIVNGDKKFSITNVSSFDYVGAGDVSGTNSSNEWTPSEKFYGIITINVVADTKYKFSVAGSKMGFYGFEFTPLPSSIDLDVNQAAGATTVYSDYALDFSELENVTAYIETGTDENLIWTEVTTAPAKTGLLVVTSESALTVPVISSSTTDVTGNRLKGVATGESKSVEDGENIYIFTLHNGVTPGFFKAAAGRSLAVGKAYLDLGEATGAREFFAIDVNGATTGIDAVESASSLDASAPIYNLAGQKVSKSFKGIVIQNGKKYINK